MPQFTGEVWSTDVGVSHPSAATWLQSHHPAEQVPTWQVPPMQFAVALGKLQAALQAPQLKPSYQAKMKHPKWFEKSRFRD